MLEKRTSSQLHRAVTQCATKVLNHRISTAPLPRLSNYGLAAVALCLLGAGCARFDTSGAGSCARATPTTLASVETLSVAQLRGRRYDAHLRYQGPLAGGIAAPSKLVASYCSDNFRVYTRVDIPTTRMPRDGYPTVLFLHGWIGIEAAPGYDCFHHDGSDYEQIIERFVQAGFLVFSPGYRGHGTFEGIPAGGIADMARWDNGSYLSPALYAIDTLNLIAALGNLGTLPQTSQGRPLQADADRLYLMGHSQGGDVALITAAVAAAGSSLERNVSATSIWSGTFAPRTRQLETYNPMQRTAQAFVSGDGSWNGTAIGNNGRVNPFFVFGYPPDWIGTADLAEWTWQDEQWHLPTVEAAVRVKLDEMYAALNAYVQDIDQAQYRIEVSDHHGLRVVHDPRVSTALKHVGGYHHPQLLRQPLALHYSDRDFYSPPHWNEELCARVNRAGGRCITHEYPGNTHMLRVSEHSWFSPNHTRAGFDLALQRDIALFSDLSNR